VRFGPHIRLTIAAGRLLPHRKTVQNDDLAREARAVRMRQQTA
jgi:hypothetical protein